MEWTSNILDYYLSVLSKKSHFLLGLFMYLQKKLYVSLPPYFSTNSEQEKKKEILMQNEN